jgi:hypothetical protein
MNRLQWLHVWGFTRIVNDRRKQASPAASASDGRAFTVFMRRVSDRPATTVQTVHTLEL